MIEWLGRIEQENRSLGTDKATAEHQFRLGQRYWHINLKAKGKALTISAQGAWYWTCAWRISIYCSGVDSSKPLLPQISWGILGYPR